MSIQFFLRIGSHRVVLGGPCGLQGIEPGSVECKANTLPIYCSGPRVCPLMKAQYNYQILEILYWSNIQPVFEILPIVLGMSMIVIVPLIQLDDAVLYTVLVMGECFVLMEYFLIWFFLSSIMLMVLHQWFLKAYLSLHYFGKEYCIIMIYP